MHATCTQVNQGNSWLLMIGSQIDILTPGPSFDHNFCFKYSNGSCEPILDIYVSRSLQWYKEFNEFWPLKLLSQNLWIHQDSNSQSENPLGSVWVHSFTLSYIPKNMKCNSWASFLACTFVIPYLGRKPKAKVVTLSLESISPKSAKFLNFKVCKLDFLYLFAFQTMCIYHLSLLI